MTAGFSIRALAFGALLTISAAPALAAPCGSGTFEAWLEDFKKEAAAKGIAQSAIATGLSGVRVHLTAVESPAELMRRNAFRLWNVLL